VDNYLRWNAVNWFTVVLMVSVAFVLYGFVAQAVRTAIGSSPTGLGG
jgi:hypothetical protein